MPTSVWDIRSNTLTFQTFRPTSPGGRAVNGVTSALLNGTLSSRRQCKGTDSHLREHLSGNRRFPRLFNHVTPIDNGDFSKTAFCDWAEIPVSNTPLKHMPPLNDKMNDISKCRHYQKHDQLSRPLNDKLDRKSVGKEFHYGMPNVLQDYQELSIEIRLGPYENVLGFSMSNGGNRNELAIIKVYELLWGSAAARAGLRPGDEILEINGTGIIGWPHKYVLTMITDALKTKSVRLKVRRQLIQSANFSSVCSSKSGIPDEHSRLGELIRGREIRRQDTLKAGFGAERSSHFDIFKDYPAADSSNPHRKYRQLLAPPQTILSATIPCVSILDGADAKMRVTGQRQSLGCPPRTSSIGDTSTNQNACAAGPQCPQVDQWRNGLVANFVAAANQQARQSNFINAHNGYKPVKRASAPATAPVPPAPPPPPPPAPVPPAPPIPAKDYNGSHNGLQRNSFENGMCDRIRRYDHMWQSRPSREDSFVRSSNRESNNLRVQARTGRDNSANGHVNGAFVTDKVHDEICTKMPYLMKDTAGDMKRLYRQRARSSGSAQILCQKGAESPVYATELVEVVIDMQQFRRSDPCVELYRIFTKPEIKALINTYDEILKSSVKSDQPPDPEPSKKQIWQWGSIETPLDSTSGNFRIVRLYKNGDNPLGATVIYEREAITIGRIIKGGVAEKSGLLREGDELIEVNGVELRNKSVNEVCDLLASMRGELTFIIEPKSNAGLPFIDPVPIVKHLRALFDYDPEDDCYLPCRELGLSFRKGDILHVISMSDADWWQAHGDGDDNSQLAGLIPSINFQIQRECCRLEKTWDCDRKGQRNHSVDRGDGGGRGGRFWWVGRRKSKKRSSSVFVSDGRKIASISINGAIIKKNAEPLDVLTYEEVTLNLSKTGRKRPIVLVAPAYLGHRHLLQKLMEMKTEMFQKVVYHTSRPRKANEQDGARYYFLTRQQFLEYVAKKKFVEWGEYEKHYYGTTFDSIRRVIDQGKACILTLKPQSLKAIRTGEIRPFIVYISPPPFESLKANAQRNAERSGKPCPKDEELRFILNEARRVEEKYGHFFDKTLVSYDLDACARELLDDIHRLENEPQWVPVSWLQHW